MEDPLEAHALRKFEYHRNVHGGPYSPPICTEREFQARSKELGSAVELDPPAAPVLPKGTGISWPTDIQRTRAQNCCFLGRLVAPDNFRRFVFSEPLFVATKIGLRGHLVTVRVI